MGFTWEKHWSQMTNWNNPKPLFKYVPYIVGDIPQIILFLRKLQKDDGLRWSWLSRLTGGGENGSVDPHQTSGGENESVGPHPTGGAHWGWIGIYIVVLITSPQSISRIALMYDIHVIWRGDYCRDVVMDNTIGEETSDNYSGRLHCRWPTSDWLSGTGKCFPWIFVSGNPLLPRFCWYKLGGRLMRQNIIWSLPKSRHNFKQI